MLHSCQFLSVAKSQLDVRHASIAPWLLPGNQLGAAGCCKLVNITSCTAMQAGLRFGPEAAWDLLLHLASFGLKSILMLANFAINMLLLLSEKPQMHAYCGYGLCCAAFSSFVCGSEADQLCCLKSTLEGSLKLAIRKL